MDLESNKFIYSDLNKRKQRMKVTLWSVYENVIFKLASRLSFRSTFIQYISMTRFLKRQQILTLLNM